MSKSTENVLIATIGKNMTNYANALKNALVKDGRRTYDLSTFKKYDIPYVLSTGLLVYDLHLFADKDNRNYGLKYGCLHEILGQEGSLKTTMCMRYVSKHLQSEDSLAIWLDSEQAATTQYFVKNLEQNGFSKDEIEDLNLVIEPVETISEVILKVKETVDKMEEIENQVRRLPGNADKESWELVPRVLFVLDSLAALTSHYDLNTFEEAIDKAIKKDDLEVIDEVSPKMGGHAGELHRMFKMLLGPIKRYGMMFVFTNHYRMNLGYGNKKWNPAHDSTTKYYISSRQDFSKYSQGSDMSREKQSLGLSYVKGIPLTVTLLKLREDNSMKTCSMDYYFNVGFDENKAFLEGLRAAGLLKYKGGKYEIVPSPLYSEEFAGKMDAYVATRKQKVSFDSEQLMELFDKEPWMPAELEMLARANGQRKMISGDDE